MRRIYRVHIYLLDEFKILTKDFGDFCAFTFYLKELFSEGVLSDNSRIHIFLEELVYEK